MSLKIEQGLRLGVSTLEQTRELVDDLRLALLPVAVQLQDVFVAYHVMCLADDARMRGEQIGGDVFEHALLRVWSDAPGELGCELLIFPATPSAPTLGLAYTQRSAYAQPIRAHKAVGEYRYWDNHDKPPDIAHDEWDARAQAWHAVGVFPAHMCGLSVQLVVTTALPMPVKSDVRRLIAPLEFRAKRVARMAGEGYAYDQALNTALTALAPDIDL